MPLIPTSDSESRRALRQELRKRRAGLAAETAASASAAAAVRLVASPEFARADRIAGYVAVRGEANPRAALEAALAVGKAVYLPRVTKGMELAFEPWRPGLAMRNNRFGIPEPEAGDDTVAPEALDLVIVPLLGFDAAGTRIGSGAGYYDRSFAFRLMRATSPPVLAGFAYATQECAHLPREGWDVPLDLVVTERGITRFADGNEP